MTNDQPRDPAATSEERARLAHEAKLWISQVCVAVHRRSAAQTKVAVEALEAFIDQLAAPTAVQAAGDAVAWQPIKTAPKDGTAVILGYISGHPSIQGHSEEGYWMGDAARNHWGRTGWYSTGDDVLCDSPSQPDVWQPLPTPPGIHAEKSPATDPLAGEA